MQYNKILNSNLATQFIIEPKLFNFRLYDA